MPAPNDLVERRVRARYIDPLDAIWLSLARRLGLRVQRSEEVFASTDGRGELTIGASSTLDADDCLAQMVFHEICHWIVQGRDAFELPDWGLDNIGTPDFVLEHACLRLQAVLASRYGLRHVLAPTTDFRAFYDALGDEPLAPADDASVHLARAALERAGGPPWSPDLAQALAATEQIVKAVAEAWANESPNELPLLYVLYEPRHS